MSFAPNLCPVRGTVSPGPLAALSALITRASPPARMEPHEERLVEPTRRHVPTLTDAQVRLRAHQRHLALWTLQAWLAMFFLAAAFAKLSEPMDLLVPLLGWPDHIAPRLVRLVGVVELGLGVAMIAPLVSWRFGGPLMMVGALGLAGLAGAMSALHLARLEPGFAVLNVILAAFALTVAVGRGRYALPCRAYRDAHGASTLFPDENPSLSDTPRTPQQQDMP